MAKLKLVKQFKNTYLVDEKKCSAGDGPDRGVCRDAHLGQGESQGEGQIESDRASRPMNRLKTSQSLSLQITSAKGLKP